VLRETQVFDQQTLGGNAMADADFTTFYDFR
jgi:hypothetical protein